VWIDETAEGNVFAALRTREADLEKHISSGQGDEVKDPAREKAREDALKRLEEANAAAKDKVPKPLPEFGSPEDFPLQQALNQLKGKTVLASKTQTERKPEESKAN
jgi:carboxyl-terminal processing protease